ncbi:MAG: hypothetical protein ACK5NK_03980 [Niabella sp.]
MAGIIKGKVKDSTYNFMLTSATVAVYAATDSLPENKPGTLLQFSLPDNFGEFIVQPLPVGKALKLIITHTGYKPYAKKFIINKDKPVKDFGLLFMYQDDEVGAIHWKR